MEITSSTMLKPFYSTPHPLAGEKIQLTLFDRASLDIFVPTVLAYPAPAPSNEALKEGLSRAVAPYPHLAGRLAVNGHGRRFFDLNNEGVLVVEATVPDNLADVLVDGRMTTNVDDLYPAPPEEHVGAAVLQIKLNRFKCGGLVIGTISHHHAADGHSMSTFFTTWASAVREGKDFAAPSPFLDRAATTTVPLRNFPTPVSDDRFTEFNGGGKSYPVIPMDKIKNLTVHFSAEIKARVGVRCSTFQCLLAHVWKKVTAARELNPEEFTQVKVAVNCRGRATSPPVPADFFGNMVLSAYPRLQVQDLLRLSYGCVVAAIRDAVERVDGEYIRSFVDSGAAADADGEVHTATAPAAGTTFCPDLEADSWLGFQFHQVDLGGGPPCAFLTPDIPFEGLMMVVPSAKGGADVFIALAEDHVMAFKQICYSLD